jgi:hypothetical protein
MLRNSLEQIAREGDMVAEQAPVGDLADRDHDRLAGG